jgi:hypothetical protein
MKGTPRLGVSVPRGTTIYERMGSFGRPGPGRGTTIILDTWIGKGAQHPQRTRRFAMVTFVVTIREQGCTTKESKFWENKESKRNSCDS